MTYRDISYCATSENKCTNIKCYRHLDTTDSYYTLTQNIGNFPVCTTDLSIDCDDFTKEIK